jgi:predicted DNA-binding WGR domain protein
MPTYLLPTGYSVYELTKINPKANCQRYYQVAYQPTLWSDHCLRRSWGRIGKKLRSKEQEFESETEALKWLIKLTKGKSKKGYLLLGEHSPSANTEG